MKVLIVDDSLFVRQSIRKMILDNVPKVDILLARSGDEGFRIYQENKPDIIITDLLMPGISGYEFIKMIREVDKEVDIFVLSADIQKIVREEVMSLGINGFLNKPLDSDKFQAVIDRIKGVV